MSSAQKRSNHRLLVVYAWILGAGTLPSASADPIGAAGGTIFRTGPGATFQEGCFPPCLCPIMNEQPVLGTLKVTYLGFSNAEHSYAVDDVNWLMQESNGERRITGSGKYRIGTPGSATVIQQRLELDLRVGADPAAHFDSGWVPHANSGGLDVTISINGMYCWDRAIRVAAKLIPASEYHPYALDPGSTFQRGCIDGACDCAVGPQVPMRGDFALIPLRADSLFQLFAVVNIRWLAMTSNSAGGVPISGAGFYRIGGEVAAQNRLLLELRVANDAPQDYDSGLVIGGGQFPHFDIVTRTHTNCVDTLLHVIASPANGNGDICGGIAGVSCPEGQFCKLEPGHCCCDFQGICTPTPQACPEYYDPVCGCDGVTYSNPCFADGAGQSIDYWGPCTSHCVTNNDCPNGFFCRFNPGTCGMTNSLGQCTPRPGACPDVWDPVCGCDGKTYGNECEADAAGVSIAHFDECDNSRCVATRIFDQASTSRCAGIAFEVRIALSPSNSANALALEDSPPAGWNVSVISDGGVYDATNHKVKWGPFFTPFPQEVSYFVTPSFDSNVVTCFEGTVSTDGVNQATCGEACLEACCPRMTADIPHDPCGSCPVTDCNSCDASICGDSRIHMCEIVGYACAWLHGCHDDLAGMTRAAYIWRTSECYCWDDAADNWYPADCTSPSADGCCRDEGSSGAIELIGGSTATMSASTVNRDSTARRVWVDLEVVATAQAVALEVDVPKGWLIRDITDGGVWDSGARKVKWGVFFDDISRTVGFTAYGPRKQQIIIRNGLSSIMTNGRWSGTVSVDGTNSPVTIKR